MKKLLISATALFLSACGGDTTSVTESAQRFAVTTMERSSTRILSTTPGELRAYSLVWTQGTLTGTPVVSGLTVFKYPAPEVRLQDISISFDKDGPTGNLYRLYQAAFGRTPDVAGLGFWKQALESGSTPLDSIAAEFLVSAEARAIFGANNTDAQYIERLYLNVLKRKPDAAGEKYWVDGLKAGISRARILMDFAASPENQALTQAGMAGGMLFAEPGVAYIPVSNAAASAHALVGTLAQLDGSTSTDANGDALTYVWTITTKPPGSIATLSDFSAKKPTITLDRAGVYEISLRTSDALSTSYSPFKVAITAYGLVADSGKFTCANLDKSTAQTLYSTGHTYLDRDGDGLVCEATDLSYERFPPVAAVPDSGAYTCSTISRETAVLLYMRGHTYLDRDKDGRVCEANDITLEKPVYQPPVVSPPSTGRCWVSGYRRKNGTYVSGYYRSC